MVMVMIIILRKKEALAVLFVTICQETFPHALDIIKMMNDFTNYISELRKQDKINFSHLPSTMLK